MNNKKEDNNQLYRKWFCSVISIIVVILVMIGLLNIVVDPYFHYHKPWTKYRLTEERYVNDGIARHFEYDSVISGNSLSENFSTNQFDELFNATSIKVPMSGAMYSELWDLIGRALSYNDGIKNVFLIFDIEDLGVPYDYRRYENLPTYLYDNNLLNDVNYIFNKDVLYHGTTINIANSILGRDSTSMDEYATWERVCNEKMACSFLHYFSSNWSEDSREFSSDDIAMIEENVDKNIVEIIRNNPDVTFFLIMPPSSVARWGVFFQRGELEWRLKSLIYGIPRVLQCSNARLYGFDDAFEITSNLQLYCDDVHYNSDVNRWIIDEVYNNNHRLSMDNYEEYLSKISDYYLSYDYQSLNEYIDEE